MAKLLCTKDEYVQIKMLFPTSLALLEKLNRHGISFRVEIVDKDTEVRDSTSNKEEPKTTRQPNPYVQAVRMLCHIPVGSVFQLGRYQYVKIANHRMTDRNDIDTLGPNAINLENGHQVALLTYLKVRVLSFNG